ncbi:hypothetical protein WDV06_30640 [Streptomyces racemochromogenes]|uniref:Lipoprotein n=1 Tax=Streptomyces racemochromogenes TaxID=67353 RepID=A0ABW7PLY7_9ACTN
MRRVRTVPAAAAVAAALTLATAGCGAAGTPEGQLPGASAGQRAGASGAEPTAGQSRVLARAEQILISRCMSARGFAYAVTEPVREEGAARSFPYGLDDVAWARAHGYGGRAERAAAEARAADPNQRYFHRLPARERAAARSALMGASPTGLSATAPTGMTLTASTDGCIARAQRTLYGDLASWFRAKVVTMNLRPVQEERVRGDARYAEAVGRWAACMKEAGRPYASPAESRQAAASLGEGLPPERADAAETALAVTEATCATSTPLGRVSRALDRDYGEEVRARHREDITLAHRLQNAALPLAERVVSQYDRPTPSGGSRG